MARRRYLSTQISVDKSINQLAIIAGDFAVMLYTWMIPHAGDDGRLTADPDEILMTVIPGRRDKTPDDVQLALEAMGSLGLIEWDGEYVAFPAESFYRYQTYIKPENRRQSPESATGSGEQKPTPQNAGEQRRTPQKAASVSPSFSPSVSPSLPVPKESGSHEPARKRASSPRKETTSEPYLVWAAGCDIAGVSVQDAEGTKSKQLGFITALLKHHCRDDLLTCFAWLWDDPFEKQRGVDWKRVDERIASWVNKGKPPPRRLQVVNGNGFDPTRHREVILDNGQRVYYDL